MTIIGQIKLILILRVTKNLIVVNGRSYTGRLTGIVPPAMAQPAFPLLLSIKIPLPPPLLVYLLSPFPQIGVPNGLKVVLEIFAGVWHFQGTHIHVNPLISDLNAGQSGGGGGGTRWRRRVAVVVHGTRGGGCGQVSHGLAVVDLWHVDRVVDADRLLRVGVGVVGEVRLDIVRLPGVNVAVTAAHCGAGLLGRRELA